MGNSVPTRGWRYGLLLAVGLGSLVGLLILFPPIAQDQNYHRFADHRACLGIPNFLDVATNIPFLAVGLAGLVLGARRRLTGYSPAWLLFFLGVALVSLGSGYYHWAPTDATLVWDRLPMTIAFMALLVALLGESIGPRAGRVLLAPALLAGLFSVLYWKWTGDLRVYGWVQFMPVLVLPLALLLFGNPYSHIWMLAPALGGYVLAKVAEHNDHAIFVFTGQRVGGHALKHLLAAASCFVLLEMLRRRRSRNSGLTKGFPNQPPPSPLARHAL